MTTDGATTDRPCSRFAGSRCAFPVQRNGAELGVARYAAATQSSARAKRFSGRVPGQKSVLWPPAWPLAGGAGRNRRRRCRFFFNANTKRRSINVSEKDSRGACAPTASFPSPAQTTTHRPPGSACNRPNRTLLRKAYSQRHVYLTRARQTKTKPRLTGQISSSTRPFARHSSAVSHQSLLAHFARSSSIDSFPPVRLAMNGNSESSSRFMFRLLSSMCDDD